MSTTNLSQEGVEHSFTRSAGMSTGPVSTLPYYSEEYFDKERERVFRRSWLCLGRVEQIPRPGDYVLKDIEVCHTSIIVTRAKENTVRAFHNVCSHRMNQVVVEPKGNATRFTCRYHGWTYTNEGALLGVPDAGAFFNLDKGKCGLARIAAETWEGWIFVNLSPQPEVSLLEFLGDIGHLYRGVPFPHATKCIEYTAYLDTNWKVIADAFAESYHIPCIHPETLGATFKDQSNPFARPISMASHGPHRTVSMYGNPGFFPPERMIVDRTIREHTKTGSSLAADGGAAMQAHDHPALNPTKAPNWAGDMLWLFPNCHIDTTPGGFWNHQFWPISNNRTRWTANYFVPEVSSPWARLQLEHFGAVMAEVMLEDIGNTERTQKGIESRAKNFMMLQDGEAAIRHNIEQITRWIEAATVRQALL